MTFDEFMEIVVRGFEVVGVGIFVIGSLIAATRFVGRVASRAPEDAYAQARNDIGRTILLGLEVLIVADIVQTITLDATLGSAVTLGIIVLVRTFLSFALEIELEGVLPWRRLSQKRSVDMKDPSTSATSDQ